MRFFLENELVKCLFGEDPRAQVTLFHLNKVHSTAGLQQVKHCFDGKMTSCFLLCLTLTLSRHMSQCSFCCFILLLYVIKISSRVH